VIDVIIGSPINPKNKDMYAMSIEERLATLYFYSFLPFENE